MTINCIVIDDDAEAIEEIREYISKVPQLALLNTFIDPLEALKFVRKDSRAIGLILLDIDMPLISGLELAAMIGPRADRLVFTTAHSRYAFEAFEADADAFLLKPFGFSKFLTKIERLFPEIREKAETGPDADFLFVKSKEDDLRLVKVRFSDILAIESLLNYVRIHTVDSKIVTHSSLKETREALRSRKEFVQLHRSFIISTGHISSIDGNSLFMSNGARFPVGEHYREELNRLIERTVFRPTGKRQ